MKKGFFYVVALSGTLLSSCTDHENLYDSDYARKQYEANWKETMGNVDPNQTWNTAASRSASVSVNYGTNGIYTVKMYTSDPRNVLVDSYLLAEYSVKDGNSVTFSFDSPSDLKSVYVACVDAENNRVVQPVMVDDNMEVVFSFEKASSRAAGNNTMQFSKEDCGDFLNIIPEGKNNAGKVAQNFSYLSAGNFVIYPMYSVTGGSNQLGLYYYDNGQKIEKIIWKQSDCKIKAYYTKRTWDNGEWKDEGWNDYKITAASPWKESRNISKIEAEGINIDLPVGTKFGFFVSNGGKKFYSEASLNANGRTHGATFYAKGNLYLGFEDWVGDNDFNDIVCYMAPTHPIILDKEDVTVIKKMQYRIAYEDLGGTNDFDFNDVVLGVEYVSGQTTAMVKLLAAGGILPVAVSYNGSLVFDEVHSAFGVDQNTMVNTGYTKVTTLPEKKINVTANFSMLTQASKFALTVTREDGTSSQIAVPDAKGVAPQAFVVADPNWEWPAERQRITDKYSTFSEWISNAAKTDWYGAVWGNKGDENQNENVYPDIEEGSKLIDVEVGSSTEISADKFSNITTAALLTIKTSGAVEVKGMINGTSVFTTSINNAGLMKITSLDGLLNNLKSNGLVLSFDKPENVIGIY